MEVAMIIFSQIFLQSYVIIFGSDIAHLPKEGNVYKLRLTYSVHKPKKQTKIPKY